MGFLDDASSLIDSGMAAAKGAVSSIACEQLGFMRVFGRLCDDGARSGYHERNGGNASYLLTADDLKAARRFFYDSPSSWVPLPCPTPSAAHCHLLVTGSGVHLKNVAEKLAESCGIVELNGDGSAWRVVWGLAGGGRPTSEIAAHVACHGVRRGLSDGEGSVLYHAHPASVAALTALVPADSKTVTNVLWRSLTESVIAFPEGVAALPWMVPGSEELACATARALRDFNGCLWALHGLFVAGRTCDDAFGLVQAIDKAALVALAVRQVAGADGAGAAQLGDDDLKAMARAYDLPLNRAFL